MVHSTKEKFLHTFYTPEEKRSHFSFFPSAESPNNFGSPGREEDPKMGKTIISPSSSSPEPRIGDGKNKTVENETPTATDEEKERRQLKQDLEPTKAVSVGDSDSMGTTANPLRG